MKIYGDTTTCRSCGGTMHRVYTGGEYNRYNSEAYQLENRIKELRERVDTLEIKIQQFEEADGIIADRFSVLQSQQLSIMSLLTFGSGEDPETAVAFIDKALASLGDYQGVTFDSDISSSNDEVQKKNELNEDASSQKDNDNSSTIDIQELLSKEQFSDDDRAAIRNAIMQGTIGEYEIRLLVQE